MSTLIGNRYILGKSLGKGSFGEIFLGSTPSSPSQYAVKRESAHTSHHSLQREGRVLEDLRTVEGVPRLHWSGAEDGYYYLVMDLLGHSVQELFKSHGKKFSLRAIVTIGLQVLTRLEGIHNCGYLHKDVKPANCLMGTKENASFLYLIDYGLSSRYMEVSTRTHIKYKEGKSMVGTLRYASRNAHLGIEQGRRDDLESLFYVLCYLLRGNLPWQQVRHSYGRDKIHVVGQIKLNTSVESLCKSAPAEFGLIFEYIKRLKFEEKPEYEYIRGLLQQVHRVDAAASQVAHPRRRIQSLVPSIRRRKGTEPVNPLAVISESDEDEDTDRTRQGSWKGLSLSEKARAALVQAHGKDW